MTRSKTAALKRRQQITQLRASGLTCKAISERLGISYNTAWGVLRRYGNLRDVPIPCRKCKTIITTLNIVSNNNGPVYCMRCLPKKASFGNRLKSRRLSAGMTTS